MLLVYIISVCTDMCINHSLATIIRLWGLHKYLKIQTCSFIYHSLLDCYD